MKPSLFLCLLGLLCLQEHYCEALKAPGEIVGYRACSHLMQRLVDCLLEACNLYLQIPPTTGALDAPSAPDWLSNALSGGSTPKRAAVAGALGPAAAQPEPEIQVEDLWSAEVLATTKPMSRLTSLGGPEGALTSNKTGSEDTCWRNAIEWLKVELAELRKQFESAPFALASREGAESENNEHAPSLASSLNKFGQFDDYLAGACPQAPGKTNSAVDQPALARHGSGPASFEYIAEVVQVMGELHAEVARKVEKQARRRANSEQIATEAIKLHYAYLTQIITSYDLLFLS